jgi:hypothetical protein
LILKEKPGIKKESTREIPGESFLTPGKKSKSWPELKPEVKTLIGFIPDNLK